MRPSPTFFERRTLETITWLVKCGVDPKNIGVLRAAGADINAHVSDGRTARHFAAKEGKHDIATELLANSASVFSQDKRGRTV